MPDNSLHRIKNLFVVDTEAPWIRSLLQAMHPEVRIHGFRVRNAFSFPGGMRGQFQKVGRSETVSETWEDTWVSIPSWHRAFALSTSLVTSQLRKAIRRFGKPDLILFTLPWYAEVAERFPGILKAYYAHDTFRFYDWDRNKVIDLEGRLMCSCGVGFGVAREVVNDLREMSPTPVHYLPMAASRLLEETNREAQSVAETDFESVPNPRVGCVGQINSTAYDWDLIEYLSSSFPRVHFVFIGPRFREQSSSAENRLETIFSSPNVHWLGPKPHSHLPAYLRQCNVLINPLLVNDHNNRRSLLRLYDYLTTELPIVSSAIAEAFNHLPHVNIAKDKEEFRRVLGKALTLAVTPDLEARRSYIAANTWNARGDAFMRGVGCEHIGETSKLNSQRCFQD